MKKFFVTLLLLQITLFTGYTLISQAQILDPSVVEKMNENTGIVQQQAGFDADLTLGEVVAVVIKGFLGLLGVIFIILIVLSGYNWMTAAGDEEKIKKATSTIRSAVIGLIIIIAAYSITYFVFANLPGAGGATGAGPG
jgi:hypothetical protein